MSNSSFFETLDIKISFSLSSDTSVLVTYLSLNNSVIWQTLKFSFKNSSSCLKAGS